MSGVRPRATRSSVQKSPTVTTGFALPMVGKMLGPWTSAPIGHRRYSRSDSGSRNVTPANSANAEGELPVDMDAHLLRDLGPLVVHDDDVPLPIFRRLAPAQGTLVLVGHVTAVLTRLRNLHDHGSAFPLPHAAFRPRAVLFDPVELAERRLTHRQTDLRLPRRPLVQGHRDDSRADLVADPEVALRVFADQPLPLLVDVDPIVHDLRDVQEAVQRTESHEGAELKDFHDRALDDLLQGRREHEGVVPNPLVDRPVPVDDPALADALDVARDQSEGLVRPDLASQRGACELPGHRIDVFAESLRRDSDDAFPLDPLVHKIGFVAKSVILFRRLPRSIPIASFQNEDRGCEDARRTPVSCTFIGFAPLWNRLSPKATLRPPAARHSGILWCRVEKRARG